MARKERPRTPQRAPPGKRSSDQAFRPLFPGFQLPEQPDKPGAYQWEGLGESQAGALVIGNLERFWSLGAVRHVEEEESRATMRWRRLIGQALDGGSVVSW